MTEKAKKDKKIEKKAQAKPAVPKKIPYTVKVEAMAPVELVYRVWAESPEQAIELLRYGTLSAPPKPILSKRKNLKATVYKYGTNLIEFVKSLR